jgi:anti-sigma regulatory factor (Ser/Thr protein kinase)
VDQEFDSGSLYALRSAASAHAAAAGLSRDRVYDVVAAAHELAANSVRHGPGHGRFRMWADTRFLYCEVSDSGLAGDTHRGSGASGTPAGTPPWPAQHGHGLWVVAQVADQFTIDRGPAGTTATASFAITATVRASR